MTTHTLIMYSYKTTPTVNTALPWGTTGVTQNKLLIEHWLYHLM